MSYYEIPTPHPIFGDVEFVNKASENLKYSHNYISVLGDTALWSLCAAILIRVFNPIRYFMRAGSK